MLRKFNPNPMKNRCGDCVVRALVAASGKTWDEIYKELCDIGFELKEMPNSKETYGKWLYRHGFKRVSFRAKKGTKRPKVYEMAQTGETIICDVAHHLVTVRDGDVWDTWDSSEKSLYAWWVEDDE